MNFQTEANIVNRFSRLLIGHLQLTTVFLGKKVDSSTGEILSVCTLIDDKS